MHAFRELLSIYVFSYFPFGFEGRIWNLIVSVPDLCFPFYFSSMYGQEMNSDTRDYFYELLHVSVCDYMDVQLRIPGERKFLQRSLSLACITNDIYICPCGDQSFDLNYPHTCKHLPVSCTREKLLLHESLRIRQNKLDEL